MSRPAVFIDRDGVINELVPDAVSGRPESPLHVSDVRLIAGVGEALRMLASDGRLLVGVSNQPAAAKGTVSVAELGAVQTEVESLLAAEGVHFDAFKLCMHHPDGVIPELSGVCECRKPAPGMLLEAAAELDIDLTRSWMVGDTDADMAAGAAAGCRTVLVGEAGTHHKRTVQGTALADSVVSNLIEAVHLILSNDRLS